MPNLPTNPWSKAFSSTRDAEGTPNLGVGARDMRPEIANAPSVRKLQAQKTLEPVLNAALMLSPVSAMAQLATYPSEAEASPLGDIAKLAGKVVEKASDEPWKALYEEGINKLGKKRWIPDKAVEKYLPNYKEMDREYMRSKGYRSPYFLTEQHPDIWKK